MDSIDFIEFSKVAYLLYLTDVLEEAEMVEYIWDAEGDVISYTVDELVLGYLDDTGIPQKITISPNMDVDVESSTNFDD